jgi:putative PIN family toxin of toxin-antitoxin system
MLHLVLDTSILIAALRSRRGASARLLSLVGTGLFEIHLSVPLVLEYEEVLTRQRAELGLTQEEVSDLVDSLCAVARLHTVYFTWRPALRDRKDEFVLELAVTAQCEAIVTYNKRDFAGVESYGVRVLTAREVLQEVGVIP